MIYILCGEDTLTSYKYLLKLISPYPNTHKIKLTDKNTLADFKSVLYTVDMFAQEKIIICENYILTNKIKVKDLQGIPKNLFVICWEQAQLSPAKIASYKKVAHVENFKVKSYLFWFLDSLSPNPARALKYFSQIESSSSNLLWHLATRTFLLILAKKNLTLEKIESISGKHLEKWQWDLIKKQATFFTLKSLLLLYSGTIKLDFVIKSGRTALKEEELIPMLLVKYLKD